LRSRASRPRGHSGRGHGRTGLWSRARTSGAL
jgi:hypothetical protein